MQAILITLIGVLGAGLFGVIAMIYYGFRADLSDLRADISDLLDDNAALRAEFKADNAALRSELKADISDLRDDNAALRTEFKADISDLQGRQRRAAGRDGQAGGSGPRPRQQDVRGVRRPRNAVQQQDRRPRSERFTEKLATGLADLEVRLNNKIAVEISGIRHSTAS